MTRRQHLAIERQARVELTRQPPEQYRTDATNRAQRRLYPKLLKQFKRMERQGR